MNMVLVGIPNCEAYLDVVIYLASWSELVQSLHAVFKWLCDASLTLNLVKCEFGKATVSYWRKQVSQGEVHPLEAKVLAISKFPIPTTKRELC